MTTVKYKETKLSYHKDEMKVLVNGVLTFVAKNIGNINEQIVS